MSGYARVVEERINGTLARTYAHGLALLSQTQFTLTDGWVTSYISSDGHGSVRLLTDAAGSVTDTYAFEAFGTPIARTGVTFNRYRYAGEQHDDELGLLYLRARYLNSDTGRFWTQDSFEGFTADPASLHKFAYANADGVNNLDPSGHFTLTEMAFTVAVTGTMASIAYPVVRPAVATVVGYMGGNPEARYSLSSIGVYDESEQLLDALGLQPEDFSKNLLADALTELGTDAIVGTMAGGAAAASNNLLRGLQSFRRSTTVDLSSGGTRGGTSFGNAAAESAGTRAAGTTRLGVVRNNPADWRATRDLWDSGGYGEILSPANRASIARGRTPVVDEAWVRHFPEDAGLLGERIPMHHIQGTPITTPLPATRHMDAHMPGGFRYNPGGPGGQVPIYPATTP